MEVIITADVSAGAALVAAHIGAQVQDHPDLVLGLATGSTPSPVYDQLVGQHQQGLVFQRLTCFALDEYVGLPPHHPESYRAVLRREFTDRVGVPPQRLHTPDGHAQNLQAACDDYEARIGAAGGVDIQILGVGADGHIGFNEPSSSLASRTRIKTLTAQTRRDNARFFDDEVSAVPHHVLTQGVGTILDAGHLILLAWGAGKATAVAATVEGPVTAMVPSSALQLHRHVTVVVDQAAAQQLRLADYYREVFDGKPAWQLL